MGWKNYSKKAKKQYKENIKRIKARNIAKKGKDLLKIKGDLLRKFAKKQKLPVYDIKIPTPKSWKGIPKLLEPEPECPCDTCKAERLIFRLQELYDDNSLSDKDEDTILKTIEFLGGEISW